MDTTASTDATDAFNALDAMDSTGETETPLATPAAGPLPPSPQQRKLRGDVQRAVAGLQKRVSEVEAIVAAAAARRTQLSARQRETLWVSEVRRTLELMETRSAIDAVELARLLEVARTGPYDARPLYDAAKRAFAAVTGRALLAIEAILAANPYAEDGARRDAAAGVALLRGLTWRADLQAALPALTALFPGVDATQMQLVHRIAGGLLTFVGPVSEDGLSSVYDAVSSLEPDLLQVPSLAKYVAFYRTGHAAFLSLRETLGALRADILQASGSRPAELARALEDIERVHDPATARRLLDGGATFTLASDALLRDAIRYLERVNHAPFAKTAYEGFVRDAVQRDLEHARRIAGEAAADIAAAKKRAVDILEAVAAQETACQRDAAEELANLKNLLRVVPVPTSIAPLIEKAASAGEIVTEAALLLQTAETAQEADGKTIAWLVHARTVIDTHPLTVRIDEKGPMDLYAERIAALAALYERVAEVQRQVAVAEAAWDAAWQDFEDAQKRAGASAAAHATLRQSLLRLRAAGSVLNDLRASEAYARGPAKVAGRLESKYAARQKAASEADEDVRRTDAGVAELEALARDVRTETQYSRLVAARHTLDERLQGLPKWVHGMFTPTTRTLLGMRITFYEAYFRALPGLALRGRVGTTVAATPSCVRQGGDAGASGQDDAGDDGNAFRERCLRGRVAAFMGERAVIATMWEVTSAIDGVAPLTFLTEQNAPLAYTLSYACVGAKLGVVLGGRAGRRLCPPLGDDDVLDGAAAAAATMAQEVVALRLELERAAEAGMQTFSRFVRLERPDWASGDHRLAAAEIYTGLLTTMLPQQYGAVSLDALTFDPTTNTFRPDADGPGPRASAATRQRGVGPDARPVLRLTPEDLLVTAAMSRFAHIFTCLRLDLRRQHEYMLKTAGLVLEDALAHRVAVDALEPPGGGSGRTVPYSGPEGDPSDGGLFAIRPADWDAGRVPTADPLDVWRQLQTAEVRGALETIDGAMGAGNALTTLTVLARMCIPGDALVALWGALATDALGAQNLDYDAFVTRRLNTPATVQTSATVAAPDGDTGASAEGAVGARPALYTATGKRLTFTIVKQPSSDVLRPNGMDFATCALLLGAPLVVAMEEDTVFSKASDLLLCVKLFDSRPSAGDERLAAAVSSDVTSWGERLLALDANPIEDACFSVQLEQLSAMLAAKPLRQAPPCLITLDTSLNVRRVLWPRARGAATPGPDIRFTCDPPYRDLPRLPADEDALPPHNAHSDPLYSSIINGAHPPVFPVGEPVTYPMPPVFHRGVGENPFPYASSTPIATSVSSPSLPPYTSLPSHGHGAVPAVERPGVGPWEEWLDGDSDAERLAPSRLSSWPSRPRLPASSFDFGDDDTGGAGEPRSRRRSRRGRRRRSDDWDVEKRGKPARSDDGDTAAVVTGAPGPPAAVSPSSLSSTNDDDETDSNTSSDGSGDDDADDDELASRVASANSLFLSRRYLRNTGLSVLGLLIQICEKVSRRLVSTRVVLMEHSVHMLSELFTVRLLLGE